MDLQYWFMFPVAVGVATLSMASGVEGATFFTPIFLIVLRLPIDVAIGAGLLTEVFGFASGVLAYWRRRLIDLKLARALLVATIPMALVGTALADRIDGSVLKLILAMGLLAVAMSFLRAPDEHAVGVLDRDIAGAAGKPETCLLDATGTRHCYTVCNRGEGRAIAGVGALFMGLISTGLGELNAYFLLQRCRVPSQVSVATSVLVVAVTALTAASGHLYRFAIAGGDELGTVLSIALFTVPGVVIGGQLGPRLANVVPQRIMERALAVLFLLVAAMMAASALAG